MTQNRNLGPRTLIAAAIVLALVLSLPAYASEKLVCRKGEPPAGVTLNGSPKIFADEVPEVGAIELAASRGRSRDGRATVRLLALRVAFLPDTDPLSTGNGEFDLSELQEYTFDSPPHDREYFELHMTALANYFGSVSYDNLSIEFDVFPEDPLSAYVLPHKMGYYHDYSEAQVWYVSQVESFTRDAFAAADTSDTIDFSQYDGYVLFHAGAAAMAERPSVSWPCVLPSFPIRIRSARATGRSTCRNSRSTRSTALPTTGSTSSYT